MERDRQRNKRHRNKDIGGHLRSISNWKYHAWNTYEIDYMASRKGREGLSDDMRD